jgi:hypothetical protein
MKSGIAKPSNYDKFRGIIQKEKENPVSFYERLEESFTNIDPSSREGAALLYKHFITQPHIRQKIQTKA